jgi:hypothetical protein
VGSSQAVLRGGSPCCQFDQPQGLSSLLTVGFNLKAKVQTDHPVEGSHPASPDFPALRRTQALCSASTHFPLATHLGERTCWVPKSTSPGALECPVGTCTGWSPTPCCLDRLAECQRGFLTSGRPSKGYCITGRALGPIQIVSSSQRRVGGKSPGLGSVMNPL